jgi:hypothetical protein
MLMVRKNPRLEYLMSCSIALLLPLSEGKGAAERDILVDTLSEMNYNINRKSNFILKAESK